MKKRVIVAAALTGVLVLLAIAGVKAYRMYYDRKVGNFTGKVELFVRPGTDVSAVRDSLFSSGMVRSGRSLSRTLSGLSAVRPGHYVIDASSSSMYVSRMLRLGWQTPVNLTLSGAIRTPGILARKIGAQMLADSADVAGFACCNDSLRRYGVDTTLLFTLVIPDTYQMQWTASVREIFDRFVEQRDAWWTEERRAKARAQGLTPREVSILASIVDGETRYEPEMPTIAGVYLNRLRSGMRLQADPTVAYCFGYTLHRILRKHLEYDSPYNTYLYAGLPPGPISCPPKSCLEAVLSPERHNYYYFCAHPSFNGSHQFAASYAEHLQNARDFQSALTRRMRERAEQQP